MNLFNPKVFGAIGSLQALTGFALPLFNLIYINTLDTYVGLVYLILVSFYGVLLAFLAYSLIFLRRVESKNNHENQDMIRL